MSHRWGASVEYGLFASKRSTSIRTFEYRIARLRLKGMQNFLFLKFLFNFRNSRVHPMFEKNIPECHVHTHKKVHVRWEIEHIEAYQSDIYRYAPTLNYMLDFPAQVIRVRPVLQWDVCLFVVPDTGMEKNAAPIILRGNTWIFYISQHLILTSFQSK